MQFMKHHCITLCRFFQLDLPQFSCAMYVLNCEMPQTVKLVHWKNECCLLLKSNVLFFFFYLRVQELVFEEVKIINLLNPRLWGLHVWRNSSRPVLPLKILNWLVRINDKYHVSGYFQSVRPYGMLVCCLELSNLHFFDSLVSPQYLNGYLCHCITEKIL